MGDVKAYAKRPTAFKNPVAKIEFFDVTEDGEGNPLPHGGMGIHVAYFDKDGNEVGNMTEAEFEKFGPTEGHYACYAAYKFVRMMMDNGGVHSMPEKIHTIEATMEDGVDGVMEKIRDVLKDEMEEDEIDQFLRENGINPSSDDKTKH